MKMPAIFVGHGSPMNAIEDNIYSNTWKKIGKRFKPKAILMISAHWYVNKTATQDATEPKQIYDMYGFPDELYQLTYPVSGDAELTAKIIEELQGAVTVDNSWGIDHGAWSVLVHMYPEASIPVVQVSVNRAKSPQEQYELGLKLAHLRELGYMIIASGNIVHNLRLVNFEQSEPFDWAVRFDDYIEQAITAREFEKCINYALEPASKLAVPTPDHYYPLLTMLGTTSADDKISVFNKGYEYGSLSMTGYIFE